MPKKLRILFIEDQEDDLTLLLIQLKRRGIVPECKRVDSEESLRRQLWESVWDCVISDFNLPGFDAMRALEIVREVDTNMPFIIVSGAIGEELAVTAMKAGAQDYLMKDNLTRLVPAIERELREAKIRADAKEAQVALVESKKRFQRALEGANDGIWDWNLITRDAFYSARWAEMLGYELNEVSPTIDFWEKCIHPEDHQAVMSALNAHINGETRTFEIEYRARTKSGSWKWLLTRGRVVERNSAGLPLHTSGTNIDMTEKKHLEEQLRQAQKMESVGLLAGGIAHDFNNILTVILGHANLQLAYIRKRPETEDRIAKSFEQIGIAAERAASLTRQLLAFSRKQVTKLETISPERIVVNLEPMLQRIIGEHIRMHIVQNASGGHIRADAGLIEQAIMNLVVNARDAMPDGGIITLEVSTVDPSFEKDLLGLDHFGSPTVRMIVRDTGVGMSHETIERIFEPFYTTKPIGKGTGLGLATVYGIVQQFKGHITVSSVVGEGTVFKLYFPAAANPVENEETKGNVTMVTSGNETVLLCEDEEIVRELMRTILSRSGYELLVAESGKQALGYIRAGKTADLLITDVVMPDMNGKRLAEGIIEEHGRIPILYVSGYTPEIIEGLDLSGETTDFLNKPFLPVELLQKVRQLLDFSKTRDGNHIPA